MQSQDVMATLQAGRCWRPRAMLWLALCGLLSAPLAVVASDQYKGPTYFRYTNEQGVQVINSSIPPEYAQKGYEEVTPRGEVIRVVPPALSGEEAERLEARRREAERLAEWDEELLRRYSNVADIEAAQQRKLAQLEGSIAMLQGNIRNLKHQVAQQHANAAKSERMGREVPESVLKALAGLEEELKLTEETIAERQRQFDEINDKFEQDKERFRQIRPDSRGSTQP